MWNSGREVAVFSEEMTRRRKVGRGRLQGLGRWLKHHHREWEKSFEVSGKKRESPLVKN